MRRWAQPQIVASIAGLAALSAACWLSTPVALTFARPKAPAHEQTHPTVRPRSGGHNAGFTLTFTAGDDIGVHGVVKTDYRVSVSSHGHSGCVSGFEASVAHASKGQRLSVRMSQRPGPGWCRGRYSGVILLERGPYCPKPAPGQPPQPCPEFASQALDAGRFAFRVT